MKRVTLWWVWFVFDRGCLVGWEELDISRCGQLIGLSCENVVGVLHACAWDGSEGGCRWIASCLRGLEGYLRDF